MNTTARLPRLADPWSELLPGLWIGSDDLEPQGFDAVLSLTTTGARVPDGIRHTVWEMPALEAPEQGRLCRSVMWVAHRWQCGDRVLIRCNNGLDRAGLVAAKTLVEVGAKPGEALQLVRAARPGAISQQYLRAIS